MTTAKTEGNATSVPLGGLFATPVEPGWCWVCNHFRVAPLACGPTCMEQDYPRKDDQ